jgi:hypothetical protein
MNRVVIAAASLFWFAASAWAGAGAPAPAPYFPDPVPGVKGPPSLRQVVARTGIANLLSGSQTQAGSRTWEVAYVNASALEVCVGNWYTPSQGSAPGPGEITTGGTMTVRAAIEYPRQTIAAAAPWTTSSTTITMAVPNPGWIGSGAQVWDYTTNQSIGTASSYSGATLTLQGAAAHASSGSADNVGFANFVVLTWGGSNTSPAIAALTTQCSDLTPLGYQLPAFARFRVNLDFNMGSGGKVPEFGWSNACDRANGDEYNVGASGYGNTQNDLVMSSGVISPCYQPLAILGLSDRTVWGLNDDSTGLGTNDYGGDPGGGRGVITRALAELGPVCNVSTNGDRAAYYANTSYSALRTALLGTCGVSSVILGLGVNDVFSGSQTTDQLITNRATIRQNIQAVAGSNIHVFDTTVTPDTTDPIAYWRTSTNQVTGATQGNYYRTAFNDFMRNAGSVTTTCTLTSGSVAVTACASGLNLTNAAPGMILTSTTSGVPASDVVTALNQDAGAATLTSAFTGTTTAGASVIFAWPSTTNTFPTSSAGLIDIAKLVETAPTAAAGPVTNGGVWMGGYVNDGLHCDHFCDLMVEPMLLNMLQAVR